MGSAIAQRLRERGCEVIAWDQNSKAMAAQGNRVRAVDSPRAVAESADVVLSIITEDKGVRRVFTGADGFLAANVAGKLFVEMSTLQPATHRELAPQVAARGARLIDSPVLGSIPTVREGKLVALVGGEADDVARARSVLDHLTRRVAHHGPNGAGCAMKLAVNLGMAVYLQALAESLALGTSEGLGIDQMLDIFSDAVTATPWLKGKLPVLRGEPSDITDIHHAQGRSSTIATGARNVSQCRQLPVRWRHARRSRRLGREGSRRSAAIFRDFMLQDYP
jgi:3-hydroxyisobutyrate dehydrogenase-like beta-hydroxyacid dehydrogenase